MSPSVAFDSVKVFYPLFDGYSDEMENEFLQGHKYNIFEGEAAIDSKDIFADSNDELIADVSSSIEARDIDAKELKEELVPRLSFCFEGSLLDMIEETGSITSYQRPNCSSMDQRRKSDSTIVSYHEENDDDGPYNLDLEYDDMNREIDFDYRNNNSDKYNKCIEEGRTELERVGSNIIIGSHHEGFDHVSKSDVLLGRGGHCARHFGNQVLVWFFGGSDPG